MIIGVSYYHLIHMFVYPNILKINTYIRLYERVFKKKAKKKTIINNFQNLIHEWRIYCKKQTKNVKSYIFLWSLAKT